MCFLFQLRVNPNFGATWWKSETTFHIELSESKIWYGHDMAIDQHSSIELSCTLSAMVTWCSYKYKLGVIKSLMTGYVTIDCLHRSGILSLL